MLGIYFPSDIQNKKVKQFADISKHLQLGNVLWKLMRPWRTFSIY